MKKNEPEVLEKSAISAMFLLDYKLPQVAKFGKTLQTEKLDIAILSVEATLHTIDDALTAAAMLAL